MSPLLLVLSAVLLLIPGSLLPASGPGRRAEARPELRGRLRLLHLALRGYCMLWHRLRASGLAPLPQNGPAILISNHTSSIDHLLLQAVSRRLLGFLVAREYYEAPWLRGFCKSIGCIPVNRDGRDLAAIRAALRALEAGRVVPIFPEGHIVPASGRRLDPIQPGSAYLAIRARVPVLPAYISGTPATDEILPALLRRSRARVTFGDPIDLTDIPPHRAGDKAVQALVSRRFQTALLALQAQVLAVKSGQESVVREGVGGS
jgi:1-acyl-sn-glycerol-3-phosphate acyltransferase